MNEKKKSKPRYVKPTLVSNSARYKIGGKEYSATDVSRLKPQTKEINTVKGTENAPRQVSKKLENHAGVINTSVGTVTPSQSVHAQDGTYKPSANTQATVQTAAAPQNNTFKPSVSSPITTPQVSPNNGNTGAKTGSDLSRFAENRVLEQTDSYYSTNAFEAVRKPQSVDAIKTGATPTVQTASTIKPGPQPVIAPQSAKIPAGPITPTPNPATPTAVPGVGSPNIKTQSELNRVAQVNVQEQTRNFHSNNAFNTERKEIRSEIERTPRTVEMVKTGAPMTGKQQPVATPNQNGSPPHGIGIKTAPQAEAIGQGIKTQMGQPSPAPAGHGPSSPVPGMGSPNLKTDSQVQNAAKNSVQTQTENFHSNNAFSAEKKEIRSGIERTPKTVDAVKTAAPLTGKQQPVTVTQPQNNPAKQGNGIKTQMGQPSPAPAGHGPSSPVLGMGSPNLKTDSQVQNAAKKSVQTQTQDFHSNNAFSAEKKEIRSGIERTPRKVDAVKTAAPLTGKQQPMTVPQQHGSPNPNNPLGGKRTGAIVGTGSAGKALPQNQRLAPFVAKGTQPVQNTHITVQAGANIRTGSQMANVLEQKVRSQTESFHSNNAVVAGIKKIQNDGRVIPKNVGGIQTGMNLPQGGKIAYRPNVPTVGKGSVGSVTLSKSQMADLRANMRRLGITDKVTTGNLQYSQKTARAFNLSDKVKEGKIFTEIRAGKKLMGKFAVGQENKRAFVRYLGVTAKYTVGTEAANALQKWKTANKKELLTGGKMLLGSAEGALLTEDDLGTQAAGMTIAAGMAGATGFKAAQWASEVGIESIKKVGNGAYQVITTTGRASITVGATVKTMIQTQAAPFSKEAIRILRSQAQLSGLNDTKIVKGIVSKVDRVKTAYHNAVDGVKKVGTTVATGAKRIKTAVDTSVKIVHGVTTGTLSVNLAKAQIEAFRQRMFKGIQTGVVKGVKTAAGYAVRGTAKGVGVTLFRGVPKAGKLLKGGVMTGAGMMMRSEDFAVRGVGTAVVATEVGVKTAVVGAKATGYTVKTAVKTGKAVYAGAKFIKNYGLNAAWQRARILARKKTFELGKSVVSLILQGAKLAVGKVALPLLLIALLVLLFTGGISAAGSAAGAIFSGVFEEGDTDTEYFYREYLLDTDGEGKGLPPLTSVFKNQLAGEIQSRLNSYDIVRFFSDMNQNDVLYSHYNGTAYGGTPQSAVANGMPSDETLANVIQPLLNAIILVEYDLEPTQSEMAALVKEIFDALYDISDPNSVNKDETEETCGQALKDGEGEPNEPCDECNEIHAMDDCPNQRSGYHSDFVCSECDEYYYICDGHKGNRNCGKSEHTHDYGCWKPLCGKNHTHYYSCYWACGLDDYSWHSHDEDCVIFKCGKAEHTHRGWYSEYNSGCYSTDYCYNGAEMSSPCSNSTKYFRCTGYRYCDTHTVYTVVLHMQGLTKLVNKYFTTPIAQLEAIPGRTEDQEKRLQELKDAYEIMQILIDESGALFPDVGAGGAGGAGGGSYGPSASVFYGGSGLMTPVNFTALTSPFGWRIHPVYGESKFHSGVDLAAPQGTPIYAAADGTVTQAYYDSAYGGGNTVIIAHDDGYQTGYCHMVQFIVSSGQTVKQGDCIGYVGSTGVSTGPHLHLTVRLNGERVNPEQHIDLNWKPGNEGFDS